MIKGAILVYFDDKEIYLDNEPSVVPHPSWIQGIALTQSDLEQALRAAKLEALQLAESYCTTYSDSALFPPNTVQQGTLKTANQLLDYLKEQIK